MTSTAELYAHYTRYPKVTTDSRQATDGMLFFALKGERFDGNAYARQALEAGAAYAIIDDPAFDQGDRYLLVEDVLQSLQDLANYHRRQFSVPVLAITGSNGKTTTKELISAVLGSRYSTHATVGNFNNHIGVPLTLLSMPLETEIAVIEMGANHQGEIAALCTIAEPTHGLITNIGKAHLEGFGGLEGVKKAKSELYDYLAQHQGLAFVNLDEAYLKELSISVNHRVFYENSENPSWENLPNEMKLLRANPYVEVAFLSRKTRNLRSVKTQLIGKYNYQNVMTAVAVGRYFKVPEDEMVQAIENYRPSNNRSQIVQRGSNTFVLDAYNANPTSMERALESFFQREEAQKVAILGDMLELGPYSEEEHRRIVEKAKDMLGQQLIVVGKHFVKAAQDLDIPSFLTVEALKEWFADQTFDHTTFLLKGSRGIRLEQLLQA